MKYKFVYFLLLSCLFSFKLAFGNNLFFEKNHTLNNLNYLTRFSNGFLIINENGITIQKIIANKSTSLGYDVADKSNQNCVVENLNISLKSPTQKLIGSYSNKETSINYFSKKYSEQSFAIDTLLYQNIASGVLTKYYFKNKLLKYDYIIPANSKISTIEMEVKGIYESLSISQTGELLISGKDYKIKENIPVAFQNINGHKKLIKVAYKITGETSYVLTFDDYNSNYEIIIDPILDFSSFFGGNGADFMLHGDMAVDNAGNVYTTGTTLSPNFPTTPGAISNTLSGLHDLVIIKLGPTGLTQTLTYLIGNHEEYGFGIDVSVNEVLVTGVSMSTDYPTTVGAYQTTHSPFNAVNGDVVVTKLDITLNTIIASTFFGGAADEEGHEIIFMPNGNVAVGGQGKAGMPTNANSYQAICGGDYDFIAAVLNPNLSSLIGSTYLGGTNRDRGYGVATDAQSNIYLNGYIQTGGFPTTAGSYDVSYNGGTSDVVVCKFDPTASNLIYSTYLGSSGFDQSFCALEVALTGEATVSGKAGSNNFPVTSGAFNTANGNMLGDVFVTKLNAAGNNLIFSAVFGGPGLDISYNLNIDNNGNIALTGAVENGYPTTSCCFDSTFNGGSQDVFFSLLSANASNLLYSTYVGGSDADVGKAILFVNQFAYIFGNTISANFPVANAAYATFGGTQDIFGLRLDISSSNSINYSASNTCVNTAVSFTSEIGITSAIWDFNDPNSGVNNTSNLLNPTHVFSSAGNYNVTFIGTNSCFTDTITQTITISPVAITSTIADTSICEGSNLLLTATGGTNYTWNNGITSTNDSVLVNISTDMQFVVFAQSTGCQALADTVNVTAIPSSTIQILGDSAVCAGSSLTLVAGGTSTAFQWSGAINSISDTIILSPLNNSIIYLQGTGGQCNNMIDSLNIIVSNPLFTSSIPDTSVCDNTNLLLTATGGTNYSWNNGIVSSNDSIVVNISNDTQFIVYAQSPVCNIHPDTINVTVIPVSTAFINGDSVVCQGNNLNLIAGGNANSFQWTGALNSNNDSIIISPINNTVVYLQGIGNICNSPVDSLIITVLNPPNAFFTNSSTLCANTNVNFTSSSSNSTNYYWNFGDSLTNLYYFSYQQNPVHTYESAGFYSVTLIVNNSCGSDTLVQPVTIANGPDANLPEDTTICAGQSIILVSSGGTQYNWSGSTTSTNDSITVAPVTNSLYTLTVSNGVCFGLTDTILISVEYPTNIDIVGDNNLYCPGDVVALYGTGGTNIYWDIFGDIQTENPLNITANAGGMIYAFNNSAVCPASVDSFYINVGGKSEAIFSLTIDSCSNIATLQNNSIGASSYKWQIVDILESDLQSPQFNISTSMEYEIMLITNPNSNCADSLTQKIFLNEGYGNNFFVPNSFTPNNDGLNDEFIISTWNNCKYFKLYIYNRWGNLIHSTEGSEVKWNGIYKGNDVPTGVYVYLLQVGEIEKAGTVTLFR